MLTKILINVHLLTRLEKCRRPDEDFNKVLVRLMDERLVERIGLTLEDSTKRRLDSLGANGICYDDIIRFLLPAAGAFVGSSPPLRPPLYRNGIAQGWIPPPPPLPEPGPCPMCGVEHSLTCDVPPQGGI